MSLTSEQRKDLKVLGRRFREIEKMAAENSIDLDVFMTGYDDEGISIYATEKITQEEKAGKRKSVFEKQDEKKKSRSVRE